MFRIFFAALLTLQLISNLGECIVCTPDICAATLCQAVEGCEGPNKVVKPGGLCQCCDACHTILGENEACSNIANILVGAPPPLEHCGEGLICHDGSCKSFKSLGKTAAGN